MSGNSENQSTEISTVGESAEETNARLAGAAAQRLGITFEGDQPVFNGASLLRTLGGWAGIIESSVPPSAFLAVYAIWQNAIAAVAVAASLSLASIIRQLLAKRPISQALVGAALTALSAWLALRTSNSAADYYLPGFYTNAGYGSVFLVSILVRWPILGVAIGFMKGWGLSWRKQRALLRRFNLVTGLWVGLFGLRLAVELPLYFAGNVQALGIAKLLLSTPMYALCIWFTWLATRSVILAKP